MHHVVAGEFPLLLQNLVLVDEKIATERVVFVLLDQLLHLVMAEHEKLRFSLGSQVHIHEVLHEEAAVVDRRSLVELLKDKLVVLELGKDFNDTLLDEVELVGGFLFGEQVLVLFEELWHQAEHEIEEDLIILLSQILDSLDHAKHELNLLVAVALDGVILNGNLILGELGNNLAEARLSNASEGVIVA